VVDGVNGPLQRTAMSTPLVWRMAVSIKLYAHRDGELGRGGVHQPPVLGHLDIDQPWGNDSPVAPTQGIHRSQISGTAVPGRARASGVGPDQASSSSLSSINRVQVTASFRRSA
jgi:hypothetical protein